MAFSETYVWREYSFNGRMRSHAIPTTMQRRERYGGSLRRTGERRKARRRVADDHTLALASSDLLYRVEYIQSAIAVVATDLSSRMKSDQID